MKSRLHFDLGTNEPFTSIVYYLLENRHLNPIYAHDKEITTYVAQTMMSDDSSSLLF